MVVPVFCAAAPNNPYSRLCARRQPGIPCRAQPLIGKDITPLGRYRLQRRSQRERQAHERAVPVECGRNFIVIDDLPPGTQLSKEFIQRLLHRHHNLLRTSGFEELAVSAELDCIAKSLLPMNEQSLVREVLLAEPERCRKQAVAKWLFKLLPPFVQTPALREASHLQEAQALVTVCLGVIWRQRDCLVETGDCVINALQVLQRAAAVIIRVRIVWPQRDCRVEIGECFIKTL